MQGARRYAVTIGDVPPRDGAQQREVESCVLQFEWIKRPFDKRDTAPQGLLSLEKLQASAHSEVLIIRKHARHVRVQELQAAPKTSQGKSNTHHFVSVESPQHLSAGVICHDENGSGHRDFFSPD